jgi:hypothetical protein
VTVADLHRPPLESIRCDDRSPLWVPGADLGYNEPTIASLLGHKTHSITSRYVHSADAVLLAAADAVANATMKLMRRSRTKRNPSCGISAEMDQSCGTN